MPYVSKTKRGQHGFYSSRRLLTVANKPSTVKNYKSALKAMRNLGFKASYKGLERRIRLKDSVTAATLRRPSTCAGSAPAAPCRSTT